MLQIVTVFWRPAEAPNALSVATNAGPTNTCTAQSNNLPGFIILLGSKIFLIAFMYAISAGERE